MSEKWGSKGRNNGMIENQEKIGKLGRKEEIMRGMGNWGGIGKLGEKTGNKERNGEIRGEKG